MSTRSFRGVRMVRFGDFELDVRAGELRKRGTRIRLQEQPFRILAMLLERPGEVVLREEIRRRLWPNDTVVEVGHGINAAVLRLREALGESAENPRYVETLARRGYRFVGQVDVSLRAEASARVPAAAPTRHPAAADLDSGNLDGQTISHYRVIDRLGGGGMGVVYRAEDLKLGRQVALKFLPQELARDPVALGRFQREARVASSLNHPNICTIYGVEECAGQPVIAMELVEGESLEARLARGPIPLEKALPLAIQMAGALDAAHRKGIVHRDFKPANVVITKSGAKVLDFGLAKMERAAAAGADAVPVTQEGVILGTLHYMSPEQVQGKEADARSDIFSFGLVLHEMLVGRRAFHGENTAAVMAAILTAEAPEIKDPAVMAPVLQRCLAKDPEERWQSARDLQAALDWIAEGWRPATIPAAAVPAAPVPAPSIPAPALLPAPAFPRRRKKLYWAAGATVVVVSASLVPRPASKARWLPPPISPTALPAATPPRPAVAEAKLPVFEGAPAQTRLTIAMPNGTSITRHSLSPDGRSIAFTAGGQLYIRGLDSPEAKPIPLRGNGIPFWSPDSRFVAMASGGKLRFADIAKGTNYDLWEVNTNLAGSWGPDGTILIGVIGDGIFGVHAVSGATLRATTVDKGRDESRHMHPQFLPDGRHFLFVAGSPTAGASALWVGALDSTERTRIMAVDSNVSFAQPRHDNASGYLIFVRERILMAQPFDPSRLRITGESFPVAGPVTSTMVMSAAATAADFSAAGETLSYRPAGMAGEVTVMRNWLASVKR